MPGQREDLVALFDHVWDRFWRRMDGLDDEEWRWTPTADPRISLRWRLGHIRRLLGLSPVTAHAHVAPAAVAFLLTSRNSQPHVSWPGHSLIRSSGPCTSSSAADQATGHSTRSSPELA